MKKILGMTAFLLLNACTTEYILMDENANPVESGYYTENTEGTSGVENMELAEYITANDVFVVGEGADFVTYQYKNVRVDEISPLASMYCADIAYGGSPYLREVSMYHNGFMRATFDCVSLAI
ncbi:MAG: hypothetical protein V8R11_07310 [Alphaproteobacteria bacterium]|jgi:hypothetical protein|nr:hypothetical protein [Acetobacter sp.]